MNRLTITTSRRGSAMILVVAILAVLLILSISFSYSTKMDLLSARNWANTVQSKMAAATGVPLFVPNASDPVGVALRSSRMALNPNDPLFQDETAPTDPLSSDDDPFDQEPLDENSVAETQIDEATGQPIPARPKTRIDEEGLKPVSLRFKISQQSAIALARAGLTPTPTPTPRIDLQERAGAMILTEEEERRKLEQEANESLATTQSLTMLTRNQLFGDLAQAQVVDTAAKLNINAVIPVNDPFMLSGTVVVNDAPAAGNTAAVNAQQTIPASPSPLITQDTLARLIAKIAEAHNLTDVNAPALAHAIALRRFGADEAPGIAGIDDNANGRTIQAEFDHLDNDHNRLIDDLSERHAGIAEDNIDNDRNGVVDDLQETIEADGIDNNLNGHIDEPGEAIDDIAECSSDPRISPAGDDRPYVSLTELMSVPGMTVDVYRAIEPYLTVFSVSNNAFELTGGGTRIQGKGWPRVDPNTAPAERIYAALKRRFPDKNAGLLAQYTVNLIDRRDVDNIPTVLEIDGVTVIGIEMSPYINEVCTDVSSPDEEGDNGEFIELFNPWSKPISLSGYSLRGQGVNIPLSQNIAPGGYLLFTDDYDNSGDPESEAGLQSGSFYDIFGAASLGVGKQMVVVPALQIDDDAGTITLINAYGEAVDSFMWKDGRWDGRANSFQRGDPRLRSTRYAQATPLEANPDFGSDAAKRKQALEVQEKWQNQPFRSALDVMLVSTAHADGETTTGTKIGGNPWALPELADGETLGAGLVDVFSVGALLPPRTSATSLQEQSGIDPLQFGAEAVQQRRIRSTFMTRHMQNLPRCGRSFGTININTATPVVLSALPGMDTALLESLFLAREEQARLDQQRDLENGVESPLHDWTLPGDGLADGPMPGSRPVRWANLSDLITDETIWNGAPLYERLDRLYPFSGLLATSSLSLEVRTADLSLESVAAEEGRRRSASEATRIVAGDRGGVETVLFEYGNRGTDAAGDPDLRYAVSAEKVAGINIALMFPDFDTTRIPYGVQPFGTTPLIAGRDVGAEILKANRPNSTPNNTPRNSPRTKPRAGQMIQ